MISTFQERLANAILKVSRLSTGVLILLTVITQFLVMLAFALTLKNGVENTGVFGTSKAQVFLIIILVPVLETLIYQYSIIDYVITRFKSQSLAILLSATAFCLTHFYSAGYIVATLFSGFLFAFMFLVFRAKNKSAILYIIIIHSLYNLLVLVLRTTAS